jgi:type II secretory pathway pseudopilin PulG
MTPGNILESAAPSGRGASRGGAAKPPPFPRAGIGPPTSGKATAALVLGLFSVFGCTALTGVPALICGILGLRDIKRKPGALKGGGIAIAGIALGAIGTLLVIPIIIAVSMRLPNFHPAQTRSKVARVTTDMRSMATAIEAYYIDNGAYPAWAFGPAGANGTVISSPPTASQPTFKIWANPSEVGSFNLLTTPISYIQRFREDPFVDTLGLGTPTYAYFTDGGGWMLLSPGPDGDYDVDPSAIYNSSDPNIASLLAPLTYDPSNGEISNGDIWRIKN